MIEPIYYQWGREAGMRSAEAEVRDGASHLTEEEAWARADFHPLAEESWRRGYRAGRRAAQRAMARGDY